MSGKTLEVEVREGVGHGRRGRPDITILWKNERPMAARLGATVLLQSRRGPELPDRHRGRRPGRGPRAGDHGRDPPVEAARRTELAGPAIALPAAQRTTCWVGTASKTPEKGRRSRCGRTVSERAARGERTSGEAARGPHGAVNAGPKAAERARPRWGRIQSPPRPAALTIPDRPRPEGETGSTYPFGPRQRRGVCRPCSGGSSCGASPTPAGRIPSRAAAPGCSVRARPRAGR